MMYALVRCGQMAFACNSFSKVLSKVLPKDGGSQQVSDLPLEALLELLSAEALQTASELDVAQVKTFDRRGRPVNGPGVHSMLGICILI